MRESVYSLSAAQFVQPGAHHPAGYVPSLFCIHGSLGCPQVLGTRAKISRDGLGCSGSCQASIAASTGRQDQDKPRPEFLQWLSRWLPLRIVLGQQGLAKPVFFWGQGGQASLLQKAFHYLGFFCPVPVSTPQSAFSPAYLPRGYYGMCTARRFASCPPSVIRLLSRLEGGK